MLTRSLFCVLLFTGFLGCCRCGCHTEPTDLNTRWREADVVEKYIHVYLQHLPVTVEDECDSRKRYVAVYSQALIDYISNNITDDSESIREAAHRTRKMLDKPSGVIASKLRAFTSFMLSLIDQPIADVQQACPYSVRESECSEALSNLHRQRIRTCPDYTNNIALYNRYKEISTSCAFKQLFDDLLRQSTNSVDCDAIDFFLEAAGFKYKSTIKEIKSLVTLYVSQCTCTTMSFL